MLFRILGETFLRRKRRWTLALLPVLVGATLASALLTVYGDIEQKMSRELRSYGANILARPRSEALELEIGGISYMPPGARPFLDERELPQIKTVFWKNNIVGFAPFLSAVVSVAGRPTVLSGTWFEKEFAVPQAAPATIFIAGKPAKAGETFTTGIKAISPWWHLEGQWVQDGNMEGAVVGAALARKLGLAPGDSFSAGYEGQSIGLRVAGIVHSGGYEDNQVFVNLPVVQQLLATPYAVDKVLVSAMVTPKDKIPASIRDKKPEEMTPKEYETWYCTPLVESIAFQVQEVISGSQAGPIRQISEAESSFVSKTRLLILLITGVALAVSVLGVMITMTAAVMERRREIGLMKAIGADGSQIAWIFLLEAGAIGLVGGLAGYLAGLGLAQFIGREVFEVSFSFSPVAFPVTLVLAIGVALAGSALPVRQAMQVEPAHLLREV